ncbi:MAG TPA: DUF3108 domain-containing protein [Longimicrobium sp.]|nr:DUF3108 domain-containing protein [Longimicrobium sp.]
MKAIKTSSLSRILGALAAAVIAAGASSGEADAQAPRRLPFAAGEQATYQVKLGAFSVGSGSLSVTGMETVDGHSTYRTVMTLRGGNAIVRVNDRFESWIDADGLFSRRFHQNQHEARFRRNRTYDFNPEARTYRRENGETGTIPTSQPLDDLSFIYFARTLPLDVGATYSLPRYFKADGNPVVLQVLRRETIEVPAGRFRTIVVRPVIKTDGLFGEGGRAEVYFSADQHRIPVLIRSRVPVVGSLSMHLRTFRPGS